MYHGVSFIQVLQAKLVTSKKKFKKLPKRRFSYTAEFKLKVVEMAEKKRKNGCFIGVKSLTIRQIYRQYKHPSQLTA